VFDPLSFLPLAKKLAEGDEASVRTSISRAYYSCFLTARGKLGLARESVPEVHRKVIQKLHSYNHFAANSLHLLRLMRNRADYQTGVRVAREEAIQALGLADRILRCLRDFSRANCK
jgi:uncharacterized protein (UPF0332 family)